MNVSTLHSLLRRQIRRHLQPDGTVQEPWRAFMSAVDEAYRQSDLDRQVLERSLDLSSDELGQANARIRQLVDEICQAHTEFETRVAERARELSVANDALRGAIQDHERARTGLERSEERFETAFRANSVPMAIVALADGGVLDANNRLLEIWGCTRAALSGSKHTLRAMGQPDLTPILETLETQATVRDQEVAFLSGDGRSAPCRPRSYLRSHPWLRRTARTRTRVAEFPLP